MVKMCFKNATALLLTISKRGQVCPIEQFLDFLNAAECCAKGYQYLILPHRYDFEKCFGGTSTVLAQVSWFKPPYLLVKQINKQHEAALTIGYVKCLRCQRTALRSGVRAGPVEIGTPAW